MRVWDRANKRMTYLPMLMPMAMPGGECFGVFSTVPIAAPQQPVNVSMGTNPHNYVIMFATGRKDATGVALFDGDIIDGSIPLEFGGEEDDVMVPSMLMQKRGIVGWNDDLAGWTIFVPQGAGQESEPFEVVFEASVKVGNVFETPGLLSPVPRGTAVSECCSAPVKTETFEDASLVGGKKDMHSCSLCGHACTVKA
jgi:hypothetical protein